MNVTCPSCATVYRVDPAKVPAGGVRARCAVCPALFLVGAPVAAAQEQVVGAAEPVSPTPVVSPPEPVAAAIPAPEPPETERVWAPAAEETPVAEPEPAFAESPVEVAQPGSWPEPVPPAVVRGPAAPFVGPAPAARVPGRQSAPAVGLAPPALGGGQHPAGVAVPGRPAPPVFRGGIGAQPVAPVPAPATPPAAPLPPAPRAAPPEPVRRVNPFLKQDPGQKARLLARALVSDIVAYHPDKRRQGLRDGTLPQLFEDEIRKSWEEFVAQVGRAAAETTAHFTEALNEILADGRQVF